MSQSPTSQMPMSQMPMGQMPAGQMTPGQMQPGQMQPGQMPMSQMPMNQMPPGQMPGHMPMGQAPMGQTHSGPDIYRGGAGSPSSSVASNTSSNNARSEVAPRLPDPKAANDSPAAFLAAAQTALAHNRTGAAQEALERAETRILSRTTEPSRADVPSRSAMAMHIADARRALGNKDTAGAKAAIDLAMASPVPPPGPAVTVRPPMPNGM